MSQKSRNKKATGFIQTLKMYPLWSFTGIPSFFLGFYLDAGFGSFALFLYVIFLTIVIQSEINWFGNISNAEKHLLHWLSMLNFIFQHQPGKNAIKNLLKQ